jgi:hypothetical protein
LSLPDSFQFYGFSGDFVLVLLDSESVFMCMCIPECLKVPESTSRAMERADSVEDTGNLSGDEEEVPVMTRGRSETVQDLRTQKLEVAPKVAMSAVLGNIKQGDFMARLEAQESTHDQTKKKQDVDRTPSVISFRTTVAKTFGRAARQLDVDLEGRVVAQYQGKEKKVVHCHKFVTFAPTDANPCDVACSVKDEVTYQAGGRGGYSSLFMGCYHF